MPRISVLLPVRNGARFVDRAVRSTLAALPRDAELVVLDDASSDDTVATLERIRDTRLKMLQNTEPAGVSAGLARLLAATDSEVIGRMDADDITLRGRFRRQLPELERHDLAFTSVLFVRANGTIIRPEQPGRITADAVPLHLLIGSMLVHPTLLARRAAVEKLGGYRATPHEDLDLWLRACNAGLRMVRGGTPGLLYRRHPGQVTASGARDARRPDPLVDAEYSQMFARLLGTELDSRPFRSAATSGDRSSIAPGARTTFKRLMREKAGTLPFGQQLLLAFRLARI